MIAGLATHIAVNDHYIFNGLWQIAWSLALERQLATVLRKGDEVGEILAPRVFHSVRQDDNAFRR
jgi:hypothetical protein